MRTPYDRFAAVYDRVARPLLGPGQRMAVGALRLEPGMTVLEAGIGTGLTLPHYPRWVRLHGTDLSEAMLGRARARAAELGLAAARFTRMSVYDLAFADGAFDRVLAPSLLSVLDDPGRAVGELARVCKQGGRIVVSAHFAGRTAPQRLADLLWDPFARTCFGYTMTTPRDAVEGHPDVRVLEEEPVRGWNFGTLYVLGRRAASEADENDGAQAQGAAAHEQGGRPSPANAEERGRGQNGPAQGHA